MIYQYSQNSSLGENLQGWCIYFMDYRNKGIELWNIYSENCNRFQSLSRLEVNFVQKSQFFNQSNHERNRLSDKIHAMDPKYIVALGLLVVPMNRSLDINPNELSSLSPLQSCFLRSQQTILASLNSFHGSSVHLERIIDASPHQLSINNLLIGATSIRSVGTKTMKTWTY